MEGLEGTKLRSGDIGVESLQFGDEIQRLMSAPPEAGSSFTALLELPANQAMSLLHSPQSDDTPAELSGEVWNNHHNHTHSSYHVQALNCTPTFPSNAALLDRASKFSVFAAAMNSPETSSIPSNSSGKVKSEPVDSDSNPDSTVPNKNQKSTKRKEREKKVKLSTKKSKGVANESCFGDGDKLPYVHVRARRGQATDSHSLAERARREKINARMKLLQELVPGCNKISGTAMVLDEIINHVQSLQCQVEFLSMRLAAVNSRIDFDLDSLLTAENGSLLDSNFPGVEMPLMWPDGLVNRNRQQFDELHHPVCEREDDNPNFITPEDSL